MRDSIQPLCLASAWCSATVIVLAPVFVDAAERGAKARRTARPAATYESVDLFAAMAEGMVDVKFIANSSREARLVVHNRSGKPLTVRLPEAFAGVPVLAQQFGGGGIGGGGGGAQGVGGGGGFGGGGFGGGGGQFNVAPEQVAKLKVATVCLEHGKDEPRPAIPYEIKPIGEFTSNTAVHELLKRCAQGDVPQRVAQAAAWHLASGLSWKELAAKRIERAGGISYPYFTEAELRAAVDIASAAERTAKVNSPGQPTAKTAPVLPKL